MININIEMILNIIYNITYEKKCQLKCASDYIQVSFQFISECISMTETIIESPGTRRVKKEVEKLMKTALKVIEEDSLKVELIGKLLEVKKVLDGKGISES